MYFSCLYEKYKAYRKYTFVNGMLLTISVIYTLLYRRIVDSFNPSNLGRTLIAYHSQNDTSFPFDIAIGVVQAYLTIHIKNQP